MNQLGLSCQAAASIGVPRIALCVAPWVADETFVLNRQVLCETLRYSFWREQKKSIVDRPDFREQGRLGVLPSQTAQRLAFVGREGCDINKPSDLRVYSSFGDNRATVGMTDKKHRSVLRINQAVSRGNVIGDGIQGVLNSDGVETFRLQQRYELRPA
jgi:hypothetical protein